MRSGRLVGNVDGEAIAAPPGTAKGGTVRKARAILIVSVATLSVTACANLGPGAYGPGAPIDHSGLGPGPVDPKPGACYASVVAPPRYQTQYDSIVVDHGGHRLKTIPARYQTVEEQILVQEPTQREIYIEPTYKTVRESVVVRPGYEKIIVSEPQFRTIREEIIVDERDDVPVRRTHWYTKERTRWVHPHRVPEGARVIAKGNRNGHSAVLIVEKVRVKGSYTPKRARKRVITRKELAVPQRTRKVVVPPKVRNVTRTVVDTPGRVEVVTDPPKYETIRRRELVTPELKVVESVDATVEKVPYDVLVEPAKAVWAEVLCENASTTGTMRAVQERLFELGYFDGPIDGAGSARLKDAVTAFQEDNKLATGGLTIETVQKLGVL